MQENEICGYKCSPTNDVDSSTTITDGGIGPCDLSQFQIDILALLAEESRYGLAIKEELESVYDEPVNHSRLYPNLDELQELGLVRKRALDKRTKEVILTESGQKVLRSRIDWLTARAGLQAVSDDHRLADAAPATTGGDD